MKTTQREELDVRLNRTQVGKSVDGVSRVSWRKMPTAEEVEDNLSQRRMEKSEVCASLGMVELEEEKEGTGRLGCRFKYWAHEDQRDEFSKMRKRRGDGSSKIREDRDDGSGKIRKRRGDGSSKIREDRDDGSGKIREDRRDGSSKIREDRDGGFVQSLKRKRCTRSERTDGRWHMLIVTKKERHQPPSTGQVKIDVMSYV